MNIPKATSSSFEIGRHHITLETGKWAKQAQGAVCIRAGNTTILVTVCASSNSDSSRDFFPLTVNYQERYYAAGVVPGGYFKREGRPTEVETLNSRLIDRSLRPLFEDGFYDDVQVIATVLSYDPSAPNPAVLAIIAASAAIGLAGLPFQGPAAAAEIGFVNNEFLINPSHEELSDSHLSLVAACTPGGIHMVESEANELSEATMLDALNQAVNASKKAIDAITSLVQSHGTAEWQWEPAGLLDEQLLQDIKNQYASVIADSFKIPEKLKRNAARKAVRQKILSTIPDERADEVNHIIKHLEKQHMREQLLSGQKRIDHRDPKTVRPIWIELGCLPSVHGTAIFTRGETQALASVTLGADKDAQINDGIRGESRNRFMLHYNFPPFCVGETGFMSGPKRREIGHGRLANRALSAVIPREDDFPYVLRTVVEILECNGSSSMATVCSTSLALMDAGVPISAPVAGIAMGLIKNDNNHVILSDISGDEDHLGDMDFKVAGTKKGITALQMDIKIKGIDQAIMQEAMDQAQEGRMHILSVMEQAIAKPREELSEVAPRMISFTIKQDKIRDVIGKGGCTIREIIEKFNVSVDIDDNGLVKILATDKSSAEDAKAYIKSITDDVEIGKQYAGRVVKIMEFGAFVSLLPNKDGFLHISQIAHERVNDINDYLKEGEIINVVATEIDKQGRVKVSAKALINQ